FEIERLSKVIRDETKDRSLRLTAIQKLRDIMPKVLDDYSNEAIMAGKAASAIKTYTDVLLYESRIKAKKANLDKIVAENEKYNAPREDGFWAGVGKVVVGESKYDYFTGRTRQQYEDRTTSLNIALKDLLKTEEDYQKFKDKYHLKPTTSLDSNNEPVIGSSKAGKNTDSIRRKAYQKELDEAEKHYQAVLQQKNLFREDLSELDKDQLIELS